MLRSVGEREWGEEGHDDSALTVGAHCGDSKVSDGWERELEMRGGERINRR